MSSTDLRPTATAAERDFTSRGKGPFDVIVDHNVDAQALQEELRGRISGEVRFDDGSRALYATDASNYRQVPIGVVVPRSLEDVVETVAAARKHGAPVLARGGGTSLAGQCCNVAVMLEMSKYLRDVVRIDPERKLATVQPGVVLDHLREQTARHGLTFGPDPATHAWCTLGGMIGNNSCGIHSILARLYGPGSRTSDSLEELEILTYDGCRMRVGATSEEELDRIIREGGRRGEIYARLKALRDRYADLIRERFPNIPRRVSGYNLDELLPENGFHVARALAGSEGTCVLTLEATMRLLDCPSHRALLVLGYPDVYSAGRHVPEILEFRPVGLEGIDDKLVENNVKLGLHPTKVKMLPEGGGWLLVEFGGSSQQEAEDRAREVMDALKRCDSPPSMKLFDDPEETEKIWLVRESGLAATARVPGEPDTWPGWEDSAVHPDRVGDYLCDLRKLLDKYDYKCALYGHFGDGCVHTRIDFNVKTAEGIRKYRSFIDEATDLVLSYGGTLSGEHGDGQSRGEFLEKMYGPELMQAFREFKSIWDPEWKMNPGKVIDPYRMDQNLRLGIDYNPPQPETHFQYPGDDFSFARAALRCVGVGKCRQTEEGTMCPSFMVLKEEKHTTRGRAHLLFEMLQGDTITGGWQDEHVKESLDLCLSCKGCKGDCPMHVDVATYKAEFLAHYYQKRPRPLYAYAFGWIYWWARLASLAPGLANFLVQAPGLREIAKRVLGIARQRELPSFAPQTFRAWYRQHEPRNPGGPRVILWPDTFNNHFTPDVAKAAVEVLERAGYHVVVPQASLCCGRPLYDYGMLDTAKELLLEILETLRPEIETGVPVVGLEPSCIAVFRDEMTNLFPHHQDAIRLQQQTFTLAEFLDREGCEIPTLHRNAVVHGHCHHKSVLSKKLRDERQILEKLGLDFEVLDSGCCGMAGAFGYEEEKYDVSVGAGERVLLPAVRSAEKETLIIADGFSCREQIRQCTDREGMHLSQVLRMAHRGGSRGAGAYPERLPARNGQFAGALKTAALVGGAALLAGGIGYWALRRRQSREEQA